MNIPEGGRRADHVLAQRAHHAVRSRAEADDVGCAKDEADDQTDGWRKSQRTYFTAFHQTDGWRKSQRTYFTAFHSFERYVLPPIIPPIFTARVLAAKHAYMD